MTTRAVNPIYRFLAFTAVMCLFLQASAAGFSEIFSGSYRLVAEAIEREQLKNYRPNTAKPGTGKDLGSRGGWWTPRLKEEYREAIRATKKDTFDLAELSASIGLPIFFDFDPAHAGAPIPGEASATGGPFLPDSYFGSHESSLSWSGISTKSNGGMDPNVVSILNTHNGNKLTGLPIVGWTAPGIVGVNFSIYHNSQAFDIGIQSAGGSSGLGPKWTHTYNMYVVCQNPGVTPAYVVWGDGLIIPFTFAANQNNAYVYTGPAGVHARLTNNGTDWLLFTKDQTSYLFTQYFANAATTYLTSIIDRFGGHTEVVRDPRPGVIDHVEDSTGRELQFEYDSQTSYSPNLVSVTAPDGRKWEFNDNGYRFRVTYPAGISGIRNRDFIYQYFSDGTTHHNIGRETDLRGNSWYYDYALNSMTKAANQRGVHFEGSTQIWSSYWKYDYFGSSCRITDPKYLGDENPKYVQFNYTNGQLDSATDERGLSELYYPDSDRNLHMVTDRGTNDWTNTFDPNGNLLTSQNPDLEKTTYTYTELNDLATFTDNQNHVTTYNYGVDSYGHTVLQSIKDANNHYVARYTGYDAFGQLTEVRDHFNTSERKTNFEYDAFGNRIKTISGTGVVVQHNYFFDQFNPTDPWTKDGLRLVKSIQPGVDPVEFSYDAWGRLTKAWQTNLADKVELTLDNEGLTTQVENQLGKKWSFLYDSSMRLKSASNPIVVSSNPLTYETKLYDYDVDDSLTTVTNARGFQRHFTYTPRGEVESETMADGSFDAWTYTRNGQIETYRNGAMAPNTSIGYFYRASGELKSIDYPDVAGVENVKNTYDMAGRLWKIEDPTGLTEFTYDAAGQVTEQSTPQGTVSTVYREDGQVQSSTDAGVGTTTYSYDDFGRLSSLTNPFGETTSYHYDPATDRLDKKTNHNGTFDEVTFDNKGRPWKVFTRKTAGGTDPFQRTYSYDAANRVRQLIDKYSTADPVTTEYDYDDIGQLTSENRPGWTVGYTYDHNGNRLTRTKNGVTEHYECDGADKLLHMWDDAGFSRDFSYDNAGNCVTDVRKFNVSTVVDSRTYDWTAAGTLKRHTSSLSVVDQSEQYNAAGARVASTPLGQPPTTYRRAGIGVTSPILSEWKSGANVAAYTPGISEKRGPTSTWSHSGIKNFDYQSKANGTVSSARRYDAFGDGQTQLGGSYWRGPWGYGGPFGYYSTNWGPQVTGLEAGFTPTEPVKQIGHRWYDPSIGRFLSADDFKAGKNWYSYCRNNPISIADPDGHLAFVIIAVVALIFLATAAETPTSPTDFTTPEQRGSAGLAGSMSAVMAAETLATGHGLVAGAAKWGSRKMAGAAARRAAKRAADEIADDGIYGTFEHAEGAARSTYRRQANRSLWEDEAERAKWSLKNQERLRKGNNPKLDDGEEELWWSHEPVPYRAGGTKVQLVPKSKALASDKLQRELFPYGRRK